MNKRTFNSKFYLLFIVVMGYSCIGPAQSSTQYFRLGARMLIPNIVGGHGEFVLPIGARNLSIAGDYSRLPFGKILTNVLDVEVEVDFTYSYSALGFNFYPRKDQRARGFYLGLSYARIGASSSYDDGSNSSSGKIAANTAIFRLGTNAGKGPFLFGFEIGSGLPFGNIKGDYISIENGKATRETLNEPLPLGILPVLNLTLGIAL
jgi:hypothetical protein